jgi:hypothetical protein
MVIFRIFRNLIALALSFLMVPFFFLMRNLIGVVVLLGIGYIAFQSYKADNAVTHATASHSAQMQQNAIHSGQFDADGNPILIDRVSVIEDGNSAFSTDLLGKMTQPELAYYSTQLYWVMDHIANGSTHQWSHFNIAGAITPTKSFTNKRGYRCRYFNETLKVHEVQQTLKALACQRPEGGWCKLRPDFTPACNLGRPSPGLLENIGSALNGLF